MNRRVAGAIVLGALALAALVAFLWVALSEDDGPAGPGEAGEEEAEGRPVTFELYFPADSGTLVPEERELAVTADPAGRARAIVLALLDGPRQASLHAPFPEGVMLLDLYLDPDGTAYVDLGQEGTEQPPSGGSLAEMMRVYSIVDSLAYNLPEVDRVALLWNGIQRESFSGHLDTSVPLEPWDEMVAAPLRQRTAPE